MSGKQVSAFSCCSSPVRAFFSIEGLVCTTAQKLSCPTLPNMGTRFRGCKPPPPTPESKIPSITDP